MCEKCQRQATNPTDKELEVMHAQVRRGAEAIAMTIHMNLGPAEGPVAAVIRFAAARAWAKVMEEGVAHELTPEILALGERLVADELARCKALAEEVDPGGVARAEAEKQTPPACEPAPTQATASA